jgi:hypothetical protein
LSQYIKSVEIDTATFKKGSSVDHNRLFSVDRGIILDEVVAPTGRAAAGRDIGAVSPVRAHCKGASTHIDEKTPAYWKKNNNPRGVLKV